MIAGSLAAFGWLLLPLPQASAENGIAEVGRALYVKYCASCHGKTGLGDGPMSADLKVQPANLTTLAKKTGGEFNYGKALHAIDGTMTVRGHGTAEMPVWGEVFRDEPSFPLGQRAETQGKLMLLTEYLRSIQAK